MNPILKKLNFKDKELVAVLNAPASFDANIEDFKVFAKVDLKHFKTKTYPFLLFFPKNQKELKTIVEKVSPTLEQDCDIVFWVANPKKPSKKYNSDGSTTKVQPMQLHCI